MSNHGGPAFPRPHSWDESPVTGMHEGDRTEPYDAQSGMTLRDYFAAAALPGFSYTDRFGGPNAERSHREVAKLCYLMADAMLAEGQK